MSKKPEEVIYDKPATADVSCLNVRFTVKAPIEQTDKLFATMKGLQEYFAELSADEHILISFVSLDMNDNRKFVLLDEEKETQE